MNKTCEWCHKEFEGRKNARYCFDTHYKECDNESCQVNYPIKQMKRPTKTCSKKCSDELQLKTKNDTAIIRSCEICNEEFNATKKTDRFCQQDHYLNCAVCGKKFLIQSNYTPAKTCSKQCAWKLVEDVDAVVAKRKVATFKNYGVENPSQSVEIKSRKREASLRNYGVDNPSRAPEVKKKRTNTFMARYGVPSPMLSKEIQEKSKRAVFEKYGVENVFSKKEMQEKARKIILEKYGVENIFMLPENQLKAAERSGKRISKVNRDWQKLLFKKTGKEFSFEQSIGKTGYADLGYGNILIDINPTITHNSTISFVHLVGRCKIEGCDKKSHTPRDKNYHQKRALEAQKSGNVLLQFFDWYDPEIFLSIVQSKMSDNPNRLYARKTTLREITQKEANIFLTENHLMGKSNKQTLCVGLFYNDELVHCQTYGKARMSKKFEWEAIRSCSKKDYHIIGAFSKCDKYFFNTVNPESVVSYVDLSISQGETDTMFDGWETISVNTPGAMWVKMRSNTLNKSGEANTDSTAKDPHNAPLFIRDGTARRVSADRLLGFEVGDKYPRYDDDGDKITNEFVFLSEGYVKVYDCGTKTIAYRK